MHITAVKKIFLILQSPVGMAAGRIPAACENSGRDVRSGFMLSIGGFLKKVSCTALADSR
jgi:hypothetical protein